MAADQGLIARLDELIALFNRKSLDLPDGLFDRHTQFLLNGTPFESMLGRSAADPLVLMIARGPAGYRFAVCLTHDVDFAGIRYHGLDHTLLGFLYRATLGSLARLARGRLSLARCVESWRAANHSVLQRVLSQ